mmetsp:Transcript_12490/g.35636  ORF Transcript_12490/g.35636 Transcript_12490/m.35636 type:complete len:337 (-) Transcript_12490:165-1175(-)
MRRLTSRLFEEPAQDLLRRSLHLVLELLAHQRVEGEARVLLEVRDAILGPVGSQLVERPVGFGGGVPTLLLLTSLGIESIVPFLHAKYSLERNLVPSVFSAPLELPNGVAAQVLVRVQLGEALAAADDRSRPGVDDRSRAVGTRRVGVGVRGRVVLDRGRPGDRQIRQDLVQPVGVLGGQLQVVVRALPGIHGEKTAAVQEVRAQATTQPGERRWRCFTILFRETQQPSQPFRLADVALDRPTAPAGASSSSFGARIGHEVDEGVGVCAVPLPSQEHAGRQHGRAGEEPTSPVFTGLDAIMACNDARVVIGRNPGRGGPPKANVVVGDGLPKPVER